MRCDFGIVGGGPAGSMVARILSNQGYTTLILEEHDEIGRPVSCAGLVTQRVIKIAGVTDECILNEVKGATIHFPNGKTMSIGGDKRHALVIEREAFDKEMMEMARAEGAEYRCKCKVDDAYLKDNSIVVEGKNRVTCRYLIGADGARSIIAKKFEFPMVKEYVRGMQTLTPFYKKDKMVDIFIGEKVAPGFFAWIIPVGRQARIGVGVTKGCSPKKYFMRFLKMIGAEKGEINAGVIPMGLRKRFVKGHVALVGDAAGQIKATSGGGLYPGLVASQVLGDTALAAIENDEGLTRYEKKYVHGVGSELKRCMVMRNIFMRMNDRRMERISCFLDTRDIEVINRYGDIDYPSLAAKGLIRTNVCPIRVTLKLLSSFLPPPL